MRVGPTYLQFQPRELSRSGSGASRLASSLEEKQKQQAELLDENPLLPRTLDVAHAGHEVMAAWTNFNQGPLGRVVAGGISVGAGVWGVHKLIQGETLLDRIEAVGTLAMAAEKAIDASGKPFSTAATTVGLIHGGSDLITGVADAVRGYREENKRRIWAGACQIAIGAAVTTAALVPAASTISTVVMGAAAVGRQIAIGAHWQLPDKPTETQG